MSGDSSHERTFQSREIVWSTFESMARELAVPPPSPHTARIARTIEAYTARPPIVAGPLPRPMMPPSLPGAPARETAEPKRLAVTYQDSTQTVDKDRFLIGRSRVHADLRLDNPNVSRQHAVIERVGAAWYIVDLGSTNGVHVGGERVVRRAIADGDVIVITSHEIRCALR